MISNFYRAFKLEFNFIKENKINFILLFLIPILITYLFAKFSQQNIAWLQGGITYFDFYSPYIIPTIILFISIQLAILRIVGERAPYGTLDRDLLAIPRTSMYLGKFFANGLIVIIQCLLIFFIIKYLFDVRLFGNGYLVLLGLILLALFGLSIGLLFSVLTRTKEQAIQLVPFTILIFFVLSGIIIKPEAMSPIFKSISSNLPLTITTEILNKVMVYGHTLQNLLSSFIKLILWTFFIIVLGLIKFNLESKKTEKSRFGIVAKYTGTIAIIIILIFLIKPLFKSNWERMDVNNFKVDSIVDQFGTYPYITDTSKLLPIIQNHINIPIKDAKEYVWNIQGQQLEAITIIAEAKNNESLSNFKSEGTPLETKNINNEEIYQYTYKLKLANREQNIIIYIWDEDKFIFIVGGLEEFNDNIAKNIIKKYPSTPTKNKIKPSKEQINNLISLKEIIE